MMIKNSAIVNETLSDEDLVKLGKQIKITFLKESTELISFTMDQANDNLNRIDIGSLTAHSEGADTDIITIRAELLNDDNNNMVQSKTFEFDIVVYATQLIEAE